jgi:hypothetical protein
VSGFGLARLKTNTQIYEAFSMITRPDYDDDDENDAVVGCMVKGDSDGYYLLGKNCSDCPL